MSTSYEPFEGPDDVSARRPASTSSRVGNQKPGGKETVSKETDNKKTDNKSRVIKKTAGKKRLSKPSDAVLPGAARAFWFVLLYLALVFIRPHEYMEDLIDVPIISSVLIIAFVVWLTQPKKDFSSPQFKLIVGLLFMMSFSVAANGWLGGAISTATGFAPSLVLFTIIATSHLAPVHFRRVFLVIGAAAMVIGIHGIDMVETGIGWSGAKVIEGRITYLGFLNDPNDLALAFLVAIPMTLYWGHSSRSTIMRLLSYFAVAAQLAGVYLANSRGSLVGLAIMSMIYAGRRFGIWRSLAVTPLLIAAVVLVAPSRIAEISAEEESAAGRIDAWYEGFQMLLSHPLFGVGVGNFTDHNKLTAHNSLVLAFAELGMVGYFFWLALIIVSFEMIRRLLAMPLVDDNDKLRAGAQTFHDLAATLGYALGGFMLSAMFLSRSYLFLLYVLQALVVALYLQARRQCPNELQQVTLRDMLGKLVAFELASLVFMYLLTRVLL